MISDNYIELSTDRLEVEFAKLTGHLEAFQHSPERREQINREIRLIAFELRYRNSLLARQIQACEAHFM
ncbi:hypothetical protein [Arthrobacter sp. H14]|uniref:hypothetical protein n=1 Tax=Arthrobacter sp. H14 TaxID=1312959 RepID=UPI0004B2D97A|nr:hypothetical protein [Arthrobacter sp. H14]